MSNPTGIGVPVKIVISPSETLNFSGTVQLNPVLTDIAGTVQTPIFPFGFASSNSALVSVNADGLCTAVSAEPFTLQPGGTAEIQVSYPYANRTNGDTMNATVMVTVLANAARTQAIVLTDDTQYGTAVSTRVEYQTVSADSPEPEYPAGWVISN